MQSIDTLKCQFSQVSVHCLFRLSFFLLILPLSFDGDLSSHEIARLNGVERASAGEK